LDYDGESAFWSQNVILQKNAIQKYYEKDEKLLPAKRANTQGMGSLWIISQCSSKILASLKAEARVKVLVEILEAAQKLAKQQAASFLANVKKVLMWRESLEN
jgi:hypothetical protein